MKNVFIFVAVFLSLFLSPHIVQAQGTEHIADYDTNIAIEKNGTIVVQEKIEYVFAEPRHGIIRDIPVVKTNEDGKEYRMTVTDISVTDENNTAYAVRVSDQGNTVQLKIGDADTTITGMHEYIITYTVSGALTYFPGHDELYWNAIGTEWNVPIVHATSAVTLPQDIAVGDVNTMCFVGAQRSESRDCTTSYKEGIVTMDVSGELSAYEGATIVVGFPKGIVAVLAPKEVVPFFSTVLGKIVAVALFILGVLWYLVAPVWVIRAWWVSGRDPKPAMGVVKAWFSPPKTKKLRNLTPSETGGLVDERVDTRDIYAAVVDLARRGYMKIIEKSAQGRSAFGGDEFDFEKQKSWVGDRELEAFEKDLLAAIFKSKDRVSLKDLDLHAAFEITKKQIYKTLVVEDFFPRNPDTIRTIYYVLAFFAFATANIFLFLVALIFGTHMPKKTLYGAEQAAVGLSLKNFLVSQDRHLKFQAQKQLMFEKLLPYAIAFGVEKVWAQRFKGIGLKQPDWYESSSGGRFNAVIFASALSHAGNVSFAQSVASKSSTGHSSGFSGGFSGGGGGGGGGGSW